MSIGGYEPDFNPSPEEELGWQGEVDSFGRNLRILRESRPIATPIPPDTQDAFDDTFRLREAYMGPSRSDNEKVGGGVPTNSKTSSKNYPDDHVKIIDGEHQTLLSVGEISEADDGDPHGLHMPKHRLELANPKLTETQRRVLMKHIESHRKAKKKQLKAVAEAQHYRKGFGVLSKAKDPVTDDKIPQDSEPSLERKKTSGVISMESRLRKFDNAIKRSGIGRY